MVPHPNVKVDHFGSAQCRDMFAEVETPTGTRLPEKVEVYSSISRGEATTNLNSPWCK